MKIFYSIDHDGHWGVGVASIMIAESATEAIKLLDKELRANGLKDYKKQAYTLTELNNEEPRALILNNGEY